MGIKKKDSNRKRDFKNRKKYLTIEKKTILAEVWYRLMTPKGVKKFTSLQSVVESRGHILLPSVVCTPETAGGGIEYA